MESGWEMHRELVVAPLDDVATLASASLLATEQRGFNVAGSDTRQCASHSTWSIRIA
jgi:hypothetical protein